MELEEWRDVTGYEGLYQVSNQGNVKRIGKGGGAVIGRILNLQRCDTGYLKVTLSKDGQPRHRKVHILMADAFIGPRPKGYDINHRDGIKTNNKASNLEYCTRSDNLRHAFAMGLLRSNPNYGEAHHNAKVTPDLATEIRELYSSGKYTQEHLARQFDVCQTTVSLIIRRVRWS